MNVLMVVSWFAEKGKDGEGCFHYEQALYLNKYCSCAIYYPYDRYITNNYEGGVERNILTFRSKYALSKKIRNRVCMFQAMKYIVEEFKPDIIHGQVATEAGRFAIMMGMMFHIPVMITEHSAIEASNVRNFPHYYYAKFVYGRSKYNACVSDAVREGLNEIFPQYEFHTIYNGIDMPEQIEMHTDVREQNCVNIGLVAGFYSREIKGVQYVLPALQKMVRQGYKVHLHVVGGGAYLQEYKDMAGNLGIDAHCTFYGECEKQRVYEIDLAMDYLISASLFESFGCAIAEAVMLGKPVVATKSGGVESIVNEGNGILVEKRNQQALYEGLCWMYEHFVEYDAEKIKVEARNKFAIKNITEKYMRIYKEICEGNNEYH